LLRLFSADIAVGRPFIGPPDMAPERLEELRRSFDATMADPAFLKEAKEMHIDVAPVKGDDLQSLVADIVSTPADVVARARQALGELEK